MVVRLFWRKDDFGVVTTVLNGMNYGSGWNSIMEFVSMRMFRWAYAPLLNVTMVWK